MSIDISLPISPENRILLSDDEKWQITVEIGRSVVESNLDVGDLAQTITDQTGLEFTFGAIFALQQK